MNNAVIYQEVTDRVIAEMEKGEIPWCQPWGGSPGGAYNLVSMRPYSFLNQFLLKHRDAYLTFNQAKQKGGHIKKGAKAERVVFWKILKKDTGMKDAKGEPVLDIIPCLKWYSVFWIGDTVGVKRRSEEELASLQPVKEPEEIIRGYLERGGPKFQNDQPSDRAFYRPSQDLVVVPTLKQYREVSEYYSTSFHELVHSTGHPKRLDRLTLNSPLAAFGSEDYSKEELVAELGAVMLCNIGKIESRQAFRNSTAYLQGWLSALRNDKTLIVSAAARAEKAVRYILGEEPEPITT